jgi:PKD repeat protein
MNHSFKIILIVNLFIGSFVCLVSCKKMPAAAFTASTTIITAGEIVSFTDYSVNNPTSWSWDFGDGGTSTSQNPSHTYTTSGTYTVTLTVTNSSGSGSLKKPNYITVKLPAPVAAFIASTTTINTGGTVNFTDQSTNSPANWSWNFGDGGTSTTQNPSHIYTTAGTYTVTLTVTNSSRSDSETKSNYITVNLPAPVAAFKASSTIITVGKAVNFTDQSINSPTSWSWNFGDGGTSTTQNPSHTYLTAGTYSVTLTVTNSGGSDSETKANYIIVSNSTTEILIINDGFRPHLSPDGSSIVFLRLHATSVTGQDQSDIWSVNIDGTGLTRLTNTVDQCEYSPQWHPNGNTIAFIRSSSANYYLYESGKIMEMNKNGTNQTVILESNWKTKDFCFYPRNNNLYIVTIANLDQTDQVFLSLGTWPNISGLALRRDKGRAVRSAYTQSIDTPDILVTEGYGSAYCVVFNPVNLTENTITSAVFPWPCLSPDGNKIVAGSDGGLNVGIYTMNKNGTNITKITQGTDHQPTWSGNTIVFVRFNGNSLKDCSLYSITIN